ncbi:MAG: metallophosphoesterase [Promethearchaeota archaeon]
MRSKCLRLFNYQKYQINAIILIVLVIMPLPIFFYYAMNNYKRTGLGNVVWVSWYDDPLHEVYFGFETAENCSATVFYGTDPQIMNKSIAETTSPIYHIINISGLMPDTKYYYKIEINGNFYSQGEFRTAPLGFTPFTFALTSDTQPKLGEGWHSVVAKKISNFNNSFVAMIGDMVEDGYKFEWHDFFQRANAYLKNTPFVPVRGNHERPRDLDNDGDYEYYFEKYFVQSVDKIKNKNQYDIYNQFYYSFNWSSVHFQILHFPEIDIDDWNDPNGVSSKDYYQAFTEDQLNWIREDLQRAQSLPFRVSLFHCPITSAGFYGPNFVLKNKLLPILHEYNVTVTVHGHSHHFERGILENPIHEENNLVYFLVGTGGGLVDIALRPVPETQVCFVTPSFTEVFANATTMRFITYSSDGTVLDDYSINA